MDIEKELALSYYKKVAMVSERHGVSLVQHVENNRFYVMKELKTHDLAVYRYLADHPAPGIPRIYDLILLGDTLYVVEEYISGNALQEVLRKKRTLSLEESRDLILQIASILAPLHRLTPPIVHRDIKPSNLILTEKGRLYLIDFDAAKESHPEKEADTVLMGTAGYAAPEQYGFSVSGPPADVYAMGVLLHVMLTGRLPGQQRQPGEMAITGKLEHVIKKCIRMDAGARYANAGEVIKALGGKEEGSTGPKTGRWTWLPPGLASKNPWKISLAVLWYLVILAIIFSAPEAPISLWALVMERVEMGGMLIWTTFFLGNYRNIQRYFPYCTSADRKTRIGGLALWTFSTNLGWLTLGIIIEQIIL